jgi:hypothetical protein
LPDANTPWEFREALIAAGALEALFTRLDAAITGAGCLPMAGQIVDATLVAAPRQRNAEAGKARIKAGGKAAAIWPELPARARQKDTAPMADRERAGREASPTAAIIDSQSVRTGDQKGAPAATTRARRSRGASGIS